MRHTSLTVTNNPWATLYSWVPFMFMYMYYLYFSRTHTSFIIFLYFFVFFCIVCMEKKQEFWILLCMVRTKKYKKIQKNRLEPPRFKLIPEIPLPRPI
eukprot:sb/3478906/